MSALMRSDVDLSAELGTAGSASAPAIRWAGGALSACALTFIVTIVLYATVYGPPSGDDVTTVTRARHVLAEWSGISALWVVEAVAWVLLAISAFVLQHRRVTGPTWLPARVAWIAVGVGAVIQSTMYAITLGAYPTAAAVADSVPALFDSLRQTAAILFYLGNMAVYAGLGGAMLAEVSRLGGAGKIITLFGAAASFVAAALFLGLLAGVGEMMFAAPGALAAYIVTVYFGVSIRRAS